MPQFSDLDGASFPDPETWGDLNSSPIEAPLTPEAFEAHAATLTPAQRAAASHPGPILVIAGAGTGKTSTLTAAAIHRIAIDLVPASRLLAVTFTNKAANEMAARIRAALGGRQPPSWIGTYHGLAARQLREAPEIAHLKPGFDILDAEESKRFLKRCIDAAGGSEGENPDAPTSAAQDFIKSVAARISRFKDNLITPQGAEHWVETKIKEASRKREPIDAEGLRRAARLYTAYQDRLREANAADFGDLLLWPTLAMRSDERYRGLWASRFDWILADEYQDINFAQYGWLRALASNHGRVFAAGDDDQAIYGWRGSDISFIRRFTQDFEGAAHIRLEENFRSTGHILSAANAVIAKDKKRLGKTLYTAKGKGAPIEIRAFRDAGEEADAIAQEILFRQSTGTKLDGIAILYRANFLSRGFEEALMRARIPYVILGDTGFYQRAEIKDALAFLRLASCQEGRQSDEAFRRVINEPRRGFGAKAMALLEAEASFRNVSLLAAIEFAPLSPKCRAAGLEFADTIRRIHGNKTLTLTDELSLLLDATGYRGMLKESKAEGAEDRLENLQELIHLAQSFRSARELLDHAALATGRPDEDEAGRIKLMTMHKAKGLEFEELFLPAWEAGTFPSDYGDPDEERRLAYVALTRGKRQVFISHCQYRRGPSLPSPYLDDIPKENRILREGRDHPQAQWLETGRAAGSFKSRQDRFVR